MAGRDIVVQASGEVLDGAREYVQQRIAAGVRRLTGDVESVRLRLTTFQQTSAVRPALAQLNLTVNGLPVRAQAAAAFFRETATLLRTRLGEQLARLAHPSTPRSWPDAHRRRNQPALVSRPRERREIVRRKEVALTRCRPDEAALTMDVMDHDFHLFVDADTGQDSLVYRVGPTGYRLARLAGLMPPREPVSLPWTIDVHPVPGLKPCQAVERLDSTEMPYRFFQDIDTGRGSVLYLRYDGHYGLLTAAPTATS